MSGKQLPWMVIVVLLVLVVGFIAWHVGYLRGEQAGQQRALQRCEAFMASVSAPGTELYERMMVRELPAAPNTRMLEQGIPRGHPSSNNFSVLRGDWWSTSNWAERQFTLDVTDALGDAPRGSWEERRAMTEVYEFYRQRFGWPADAEASWGWPVDGESWTSFYGSQHPSGLMRMWGIHENRDGRQVVTIRAVVYINKAAELLEGENRQATFDPKGYGVGVSRR